MTAPLFQDLGITFMDPENLDPGLKQVKPQDDAQIISVIPALPDMPTSLVQIKLHYFDQIKRTVRCTGGACCEKAKELKALFATLTDEEKKGRSDGQMKTRFFFPVVKYQGNNVQSYGGPIEIKYMNISWTTWNDMDAASRAINPEIAKYFERDFLLTKDTSKPGFPVPKLTHLESKAKWLTDPNLFNEVQNQLANLSSSYKDCWPKAYSEEEFNNLWVQHQQQARASLSVAEQQVGLTAAPAALYTPPVILPQQVAVAPPVYQQPAIQQPAIQQPAIIPSMVAQPVTLAQPPVAVAPEVILPQPVAVAQPVAQPVPMVAEPVPMVAEPVPMVAEPVPMVAPAPPTTISQTEIDISNMGDLDSIINSLPQ